MVRIHYTSNQGNGESVEEVGARRQISFHSMRMNVIEPFTELMRRPAIQGAHENDVCKGPEMGYTSF